MGEQLLGKTCASPCPAKNALRSERNFRSYVDAREVLMAAIEGQM